jgi:hypothetical protein
MLLALFETSANSWRSLRATFSRKVLRGTRKEHEVFKWIQLIVFR